MDMFEQILWYNSVFSNPDHVEMSSLERAISSFFYSYIERGSHLRYVLYRGKAKVPGKEQRIGNDSSSRIGAMCDLKKKTVRCALVFLALPTAWPIGLALWIGVRGRPFPTVHLCFAKGSTPLGLGATGTLETNVSSANILNKAKSSALYTISSLSCTCFEIVPDLETSDPLGGSLPESLSFFPTSGAKLIN